MKIAFLGDIAFLGNYDKSSAQGVEKKLQYLKEHLAGYDCVIANLESPLTGRNASLVCKSMHLKADPCNVELLKYLGVTAVSLANNHIADYGVAGLSDTIRILDQAGIAWFGVGEKDWIFEQKDQKIAVSGYCCYSANGTHYGGKRGINPLTFETLKKQLERDKDRNAFSVFALHWGLEHTNYPAPEHARMIRTLLDGRSAVVCGHHPHIIQSMEKYQNSLIAYSLGNAVFDRCISKNKRVVVELNENNRIGFILGVEIQNDQIVGYQTDGFYIKNSGIEAYDIEPYLKHISEQFSHEIENSKHYKELRKEQFDKVIADKFGKHDLKWLCSRLNYYAIGARIAGTLRNRKYRKEMGKFIHE